MESPHRTAVITILLLVAIIGLGVTFFGSPQTGLASKGADYLTKEIGSGEDVAMTAAQTCYPIRKRFNSYMQCCSGPCTEECSKEQGKDLRICQSVCQKNCVSIITSIYLKRRPGFVGSTNKGPSNRDYVIYGQEEQ